MEPDSSCKVKGQSLSQIMLSLAWWPDGGAQVENMGMSHDLYMIT